MPIYLLKISAEHVPWVAWKNLEYENAHAEHITDGTKPTKRGFWIMSNSERISDDGSEVKVVAFPWVMEHIQKQYSFLQITCLSDEQSPYHR